MIGCVLMDEESRISKIDAQIKSLRDSIKHHRSINDTFAVKRLQKSLDELIEKLRKAHGS
jgi:hypothetical protein